MATPGTPEAVQAAAVTAHAMVEAAQITASATQFNGIVAAAAALVAVFGVAITAAVAYFNAVRPIRIQEQERATAANQLRAELRAHLGVLFDQVDDTLEAYRGGFEAPVELRVLNTHAIGNMEPYRALGPEVAAAIVNLGARADAYRQAKRPFQDRYGVPGGDPARLEQRPDGFDAVITAAQAFREALANLGETLGSSSRR